RPPFRTRNRTPPMPCFADSTARLRRSRRSAHKLSHVISQSILCIARFVKASFHQRLDPLLRGWSYNRSEARIPPSCDLDIRWQASSVDKALGINDCPPVERGDPGRERLDKAVKVSIRQRPIHIAIELGQVPSDVIRT